MRLAWLLPGGFDPSGTERIIAQMVHHAERIARDHTLHVYMTGYRDPAPSFQQAGATVHYIPRRNRGTVPWQTLGRLLLALRHDGPFDVIHGWWAAPHGWLAWRLGRLLHRPSVITLMGGELADLPQIDYGTQRSPVARGMLAKAMHGSARNTAGSRKLSEEARELGFAIETVAHGVPVDELCADPRPAPEGPPWRLLYAGGLNRVKDPFCLLRAFARVAAAVPGAHLDLAGPDVLNGQVQALAAELGVTDATTFHGALPFQQVCELYAQAHLVLLPSLHEGAPMVVPEAAAFGVPVVGTMVGYVPELQPEAAWGVAPGDDAALAEGIVALLRDRERRLAIGAAARDWAVRHDADHFAAELNRVYREVCGVE